MQAVDTYLAVRRAVDFKLKAVEGYLRNFAQFATCVAQKYYPSLRDFVGSEFACRISGRL